jgi:hypothetical protein
VFQEYVDRAYPPRRERKRSINDTRSIKTYGIGRGRRMRPIALLLVAVSTVAGVANRGRQT